MALIDKYNKTSFHQMELEKELKVQNTSEMRVRYDVYTHFHSFVNDFLSQLNKKSLDGLLDPKFIDELDKRAPDLFSNLYKADEVVREKPKNEVDVDAAGAYSVYNWELFFHVPFTIAVHLSKSQRFEDAQNWFHYIFDPTNNDKTVAPPTRFWNFKAFREKTDVQLIDDILTALSGEGDDALKAQVEASIAGWRENPFQPHAIARTRFVAYQFSVIMKYLDNLIAWGDSLFRQDSIETINEATQLYVLAANILGDKPQEVPRRSKPKPKTFGELRGKTDAFSNALVELENQFPFNANQPLASDSATEQIDTLFGIGKTLYFCIPENDKLLGYWDTVADRLFKIRHCMNIQGIVRQLPLFQPPIDPGMLVKAAAAGIDLSSVISGLNQPVSPVRSSLILQKALELAGEVRSLGNSLLSALEKQNGETLALLRQKHEISMMELNQDVRLLQWKEAESNTDALLKSRESAFQRYSYYQMLLGRKPEDFSNWETIALQRQNLLEGTTIEERESAFNSIYREMVGNYSSNIEMEDFPASGRVGEGRLHLNTNEDAELNSHLPRARDSRLAASVADTLAAVLTFIPEFNLNLHYWGIGTQADIAGGTKLADASKIASSIARTVAGWEQDQAGMASKTASYERRAEDWSQQSNQAAKELEHIGKQIISSLIREQITKKEYENQARQLEHSRETDDFMKGKFTNEDLYKWMQGELSRIHYDCYKFAFDTAKKAEQTMKWELMRPETDERTFVKFNYWDGGRKGLLAGDSLYLDLKRMELAYLENNKREYELTKHISIRQVAPLSLLELKATGVCTIELPEWLYDLDCPGHYMRRIKSVGLSIPAIAGPYTSVNCTLSIQKSSIRKSSLLQDNEYARQEEDNRFADYFTTLQAIVTSSAQNDSGLFEVNLRDERFLPFENAGAISTWGLQLPSELRQFDYNTIADVILHIRYTAREGGALLGEGATSYIKDELLAEAGTLTQLFSLKHDFPNDWHQAVTSVNDFTTSISRDYFPYIAQTGDLTLSEDSPFHLFFLDKEKQELQPVAGANVTVGDDALNDEGRNLTLTISGLDTDEDTYFLLVNYAVEF
ncbi:toxin [Cyclobacterium jeungdonense]|uniref:Tc toxin complex TcA C-terminal TcB-binding domain-containing protein n=1 Tax=Cyclobacterium jeungdonense TaxID=708087 RepID=A0ABT8CAF0_9BACT|nr:toxin [Cyclobacterium jeungdonense]MDN3689783.1 hypothetical protein [Cyclobacterium jeungdonense]